MFFTNVAAYDDISITYKFWPFSKPVTVKKDDIAEVFWRENRYGIYYAINMDRPVDNYFGGVLSYVFHYRKQGFRIPIRGCSFSEKAFRAMFASHPHLLKVKN